jgi:hypothetical protein
VAVRPEMEGEAPAEPALPAWPRPNNVIPTKFSVELFTSPDQDRRIFASRIFCLPMPIAALIAIDSNTRMTDLWGMTSQAPAIREAPAQAKLRPPTCAEAPCQPAL